MLEAGKKYVNFVDLLFVDIDGVRKAVGVPYEKYEEGTKENKWFDGSSIAGFNSIEMSDMRLKPDENTFHVLPWTEAPFQTAVVLCDVHNADGSIFEEDPKHRLYLTLHKYKKNGWRYLVGSEVEFFILKKDGDRWVPHDDGEYFHFKPGDEGERMRQEVCNYLAQMGVKAEALHHEVAPGQHEIAIEYDDADKFAFKIYLLKMTIEYVAAKHGYRATFMPKPFTGMNGSGMHTHQSVWDEEKKVNLFYDPNDDSGRGLSKLAKQFLAGQLKYLREISIYIAPTANSYKRLVPGYEAPVYVCWGKQNRSAALRLPAMTKLEMEKGMRVELRCPDPSSNPYLAFAAMALAGLRGMTSNNVSEYLMPSPIEESAYEMSEERRRSLKIDSLPGSLLEAIKEASFECFADDLLGSNLMKKYLAIKKAEWRDYHSFQVTPWELEKYL